MIGKGKSISHTRASIGYGWNQEKHAEIVHSQHLAGENPKQITEEFKIIQEQNQKCEKNTLSFVLSPTVEDGRDLSKKELKDMTKNFIEKMGLGKRQAIAFVHRDKEHTHVHLYVNRIGFDGRAYKDSFIGKRSQQKAHEVAKEMGLTTARDVQRQRLNDLQRVRSEIRSLHEKTMAQDRPKDFDRYINAMKQREVRVIPCINKANRLQGFRFEYQGHNLKGSEVHRSMSGANLAAQISKNTEMGIRTSKTNTVNLLGKTTQLSVNLAAGLAKQGLKMAVKKTMGLGMEI